MDKPLLGRKIAVLVANGFSERDLTFTQKAVASFGADLRVVGMDHGLVNGWSADGWGLNFAADAALNRALAADYDMLLVPGGQRSVDKLLLTAHTRRFIGGFIDAGKKIVMFEEALELLIASERISGMSVSGPAALREQAEALGAKWSEAALCIDGAVMSGFSKGEARPAFIEGVIAFLIGQSLVAETVSESVAA